MSMVQHRDGSLLLRIYLQPKASRDQIIGQHQNEIKIAITAPPVEGQANAHLVKFLAKQFAVAQHQVVIEKGKLSRHKQILILQPQQIPSQIVALLEK